MKLNTILNYLGWAAGIAGGLLVLGGVIGFLTGGPFLGVANFYNFFYFANSFLLFAIFLVAATRCCCCCKDDKCCTDEGKKE
jgi:hypothetical protein